MFKYITLFLLLFLNSFNGYSQRFKPYHLHNAKYEHFLTRNLVTTKFDKLINKQDKYQGKHLTIKGLLVFDDSKVFIYANQAKYNEFLNGSKVYRFQLLLKTDEIEFLRESCHLLEANIYGTFQKSENQNLNNIIGTFSNLCIIP